MSSLMSPSSSHQLPSYTSPEPSPNSAAIDDLLAEALQQRSKCLARKKLAEERMDQGTAQLYAHQKHHHNLQKQYQAYQHEFISATDSLDEVERKILELTKLQGGSSPVIPTEDLPINASRHPSLSSSHHSPSHSSDSSASHISTMSAW